MGLHMVVLGVLHHNWCIHHHVKNACRATSAYGAVRSQKTVLKSSKNYGFFTIGTADSENFHANNFTETL